MRLLMTFLTLMAIVAVTGQAGATPQDCSFYDNLWSITTTCEPSDDVLFGDVCAVVGGDEINCTGSNWSTVNKPGWDSFLVNDLSTVDGTLVVAGWRNKEYSSGDDNYFCCDFDWQNIDKISLQMQETSTGYSGSGYTINQDYVECFGPDGDEEPDDKGQIPVHVYYTEPSYYNNQAQFGLMAIMTSVNDIVSTMTTTGINGHWGDDTFIIGESNGPTGLGSLMHGYTGADLVYWWSEEGRIEASLGGGNDKLYIYVDEVEIGNVTMGNGSDIIYNYADTITWNLAPFQLASNSGVDKYYGYGSSDDWIECDDYCQVFAGAGDDWIWGGEDGDLLSGGNGEDVIYGGDGVDYIYGCNHDDFLCGGDQADFIYEYSWGGSADLCYDYLDTDVNGYCEYGPGFPDGYCNWAINNRPW